MEEPDAGASRGQEDHRAGAAWLGGAEDGGAALAATSQRADVLGDGGEVSGAPEAGLYTEEEGNKGSGFAVGIVDPVESVSASLEGRRCEADNEERSMGVEEEEGGLVFAPRESAGPGSLPTCYLADGGLSDEALYAPCGEVVCAKDVGCVYDMLDKVTEQSQCDGDVLAGSRGDCSGLTELKTSTEDMQMACEKGDVDNVGLSDLMKHGSNTQPCRVDGVGCIMDANNELQKDDLIPNFEAEVSGTLHRDSVLSVSGSIVISLDGRTVQFGQIPGDPVTLHIANGRIWNKGVCAPTGEGSQSIDVGHMYGMVDMATEGSPCQQASDRGVLNDLVDIKTSREDLEMCWKEPLCDNESFPELVKHYIERLPCSIGVTCLKKKGNHDLKKDCFLPKVGEEDSWIVHEDSVSSISDSSIAVSLDGKAGRVGELSEHRATMEDLTFVSQGEGMLCHESAIHRDAPQIRGSCSRREVNTSEEDLRTCWMEVFHDDGELSDPGKYCTEKFSGGADGLTLITGANHDLEKVDFLSNFDAAVSGPVNEASVPSIYGSSIEDSSMEESNRSNLSVCKASMDNLKSCGPCAVQEMQPASKICGTSDSELSPERDLCSSSPNRPHGDEPCCRGRESSALCPRHEDSAVNASCPLDHLEERPSTFNSADDKSSSVDFVGNANDGESQSQELAPMIVFRRNPKRAASSRNLNSEKTDQINKANRGAHKPKKVGTMGSLHQSMNMFPNRISKGRKGIIRPLKSSNWGSLQKLLDNFFQRDGPSASNSHPTCLEKGSSDDRSDQKRQLSIRKNRSSRSSRSKCSTVSVIGHAANGLSGQPMFSGVADTDAFLEGQIENIPKLSSHALVNASDKTSEIAEPAGFNHAHKLRSVQTHTQQLERGLASSTHETCAAYIHGECAKLLTSEPLNNANGTGMLHVGFSPDSVLEVASVMCESNVSTNHDVIFLENSTDTSALNRSGHHPSVSSSSDFGKDQVPSSMQLLQQAETVIGDGSTRKEETDPGHTIIDNDIGEGKLQASPKSSTVRKHGVVKRPCSKKKDGTKGRNMNSRSSTKVSSCEVSKLRAFSNDSVSPDLSELLLHKGLPEFDSSFETLTSATQDLCMHEHDSVTDRDKGSAFLNLKSPKHKEKDPHAGKKGKVQDPHSKKGKGKKKNMAHGTSADHELFNLPSSELGGSHMNEHGYLSPATEPAFKNSGTISTELSGIVTCKTDGAYVPPQSQPRAAWVCCDDCQKWRYIPAELADLIGETNCRWTCKDNGDKAFADCSIPQEKTNAEINAELELSDASADEADNDGSISKASKTPSWTHVRSNLFLHRNRRTQSIDETMVCNCKLPQDGRMGCRDGCLNRMLNIECVKRTCPCGEQCSNQKFQRRSYAKLRWFHSGKKGYGLQLQEDVSEGRFLIEYVGEVLDITSYESRQNYYASKGQKHFYFMALNGGEVIDACTKGNLGRFINHSCSPNCRTEKWMVNGEVCIGIFAMRTIKKGEELTFDYNYVRVSGAAPQKCFCGTAKCRGYIGGDISVLDTITQDDLEAGHLEHVVVDEDAEELLGTNGSGSHGSHPDVAEPEFSGRGEDSYDCPTATADMEPLQQTAGTVLDLAEPENSMESLRPHEDEDGTRTLVHVSQTIESFLQPLPVRVTQSSDFLQKTTNTTKGSKTQIVNNGSTPSYSYASNLVPGFNGNKRTNLKQHRNVKPSSSRMDNEHVLGVEGRLNSLLDGDGGISKRKDATNGYLKLLLVTAAEGGNAGGTSKSIRDLSLILDAILKTKSRRVLLDIINKNGLQMLHNILKQNRGNIIRIPIIRKLLKVLEFIGNEGILTSEHINGGPPCAGVESFRDSILSLTRHKDNQVHQIARSFCDRWFPCNIARSEPTEYPRAFTSRQDIQGTNTAWNSARRKRKSRWDYQPDEHYRMVALHASLVRNQIQGNQGMNSYRNVVPVTGSSAERADDEAPPGFEFQQECRPAQASLDCEVAPALLMERYQPSLGTSYGIPVALVQQFGAPEAEGGQHHQKWKVAPGVPFTPFPPVPTYPRGSPCPSTSSQMSQDGASPVQHNNSGHCGRTAGRNGRVHRTWRNEPRTRWPYNSQGRRFSSDHRRFERFQSPRPK